VRRRAGCFTPGSYPDGERSLGEVVTFSWL
jgi:hypothetical protein